MSSRRTPPRLLTIAGSDSGGGAGIQADLKTFAALGVYGASAITALTAQNTLGVRAVLETPPDFVAAQIDAVFEDIGVDAVKIGMLGSAPVARAVAGRLRWWLERNPVPVVLDPVMIAKSGHALLRDDAVEAVIEDLLPLATLVTPNLPELERITGVSAGLAGSEAERLRAASPSPPAARRCWPRAVMRREMPPGDRWWTSWWSRAAPAPLRAPPVGNLLDARHRVYAFFGHRRPAGARRRPGGRRGRCHRWLYEAMKAAYPLGSGPGGTVRSITSTSCSRGGRRRRMSNMNDILDLLVVGAGPTGIAIGAEARRRGLSVLLVDRGPLTAAIQGYPPSWSSSPRATAWRSRTSRSRSPT